MQQRRETTVGGSENSDNSLTPNKRKSKDTDGKTVSSGDPKKAKIDNKSTRRPGFTEERFNETSYYHENGNSPALRCLITLVTRIDNSWLLLATLLEFHTVQALKKTPLLQFTPINFCKSTPLLSYAPVCCFGVLLGVSLSLSLNYIKHNRLKRHLSVVTP